MQHYFIVAMEIGFVGMVGGVVTARIFEAAAALARLVF